MELQKEKRPELEKKKEVYQHTRVNKLRGRWARSDLWVLILVGSATGHPDTYEKRIR